MVDFTKASLPRKKREYLGHKVRGTEVKTSLKKKIGSKIETDVKSSRVRLPGQIFKETEQQKEKRLRLHRKKQLALSRFNLNGDADSDEEIIKLSDGRKVHDIQSGNIIEDFDDRQDDLINDSDDQEEKQMSVEATSLHFGGGGDEAEKEAPSRKSRKEIYSEIMAKSKMSKSEQAKCKVKNAMLLENIDATLQSVIGELEMRPSKKDETTSLCAEAEEMLVDDRSKSSKALEDDFDRLTRAFRTTIIGKASDRIKTSAEMAMDRKKKLELLETERQMRLKLAQRQGDGDGDADEEEGASDGDETESDEDESESDSHEKETGDVSLDKETANVESDHGAGSTSDDDSGDGETGEKETETAADIETADDEDTSGGLYVEASDSDNSLEAEKKRETADLDKDELENERRQETADLDKDGLEDERRQEEADLETRVVDSDGEEVGEVDSEETGSSEEETGGVGDETRAESDKGEDDSEVWMRNVGSGEECLPLHFSKLPSGFEETCTLFGLAVDGDGYYKLIKRLMVSVGSAKAREWSEFWMRFLQHLVQVAIDDFTRFDSLKRSRAWPEMIAELQTQPAVCANFASCCIGRMTISLPENEEYIVRLASQWETRRDTKPALEDYAEGMISLTKTIRDDPIWQRLIPTGEEGFRQRLLVALTITKIFAPQSEVVQNLLAVVVSDVSGHWALTGWLPWQESSDFTLENLPADELIVNAETGKVDEVALTNALETFVCLSSMCAPANKSSKTPEWMETAQPPSYRYCVELFQMASILILACSQKIKNKRINRAFEETLQTTLTIFGHYLDNFISPSQAGHIITAAWLRPIEVALEMATGKTDDNRVAKCYDFFTNYSHKIAQTKLIPLTTLCKRPRGIKQLRAQFVDIRDADFFGKAKSGGLRNSFRQEDEERHLKRQLNSERRGAAKDIRRAAEETAQIQTLNKRKHTEHQKAQSKRFETIIQQDSIELKKMRSQGRSMDTKESGPYRANKKARVAKGGR